MHFIVRPRVVNFEIYKVRHRLRDGDLDELGEVFEVACADTVH